MKRAAVQEQVCVGVGLEQNDEWRVGLAPSPKEPPVAPRKWAVVRRGTPSHRPCSEAWSLSQGKGLSVPACPLAI